MTPYQARLGVDVFTGAVIASVALALAGLTWRLAGEPGIGPAVAPVAPGAAATSDIGPLLALSPFGAPMATVAAAAGDGSLRLKGIFLAQPMEASVVLLATSDGKVASYTIGAPVGGGVIETIEAEQITLRTPSGLQVIGFNPPPAMAGAAPSADPGAVAAAAIGAAAAVAGMSTNVGTIGAVTPAGPPVNPAGPQPVTGAAAVRALIPRSAQGQVPPPAPSPSTSASGVANPRP